MIFDITKFGWGIISILFVLNCIQTYRLIVLLMKENKGEDEIK